MLHRLYQRASGLYKTGSRRLTGLSGVALLILRAVVGWLFILHALFKFQLGTAAFANFVLKPADLPLAGTLSWFVPTMELVAGILIIVGLLTRLAAVLLAMEMVFTGFVYKLADLHTGVLGPHGTGGAELDFVYLAAFLLILIAGPGPVAVDRLLRLEPRPQEEADEAEEPSLSPVTADTI
ncbi:DoxX family protein [Streptomyces chartreusis]|uniref:DoxX family protein n=1 Tax=Streptomyces chartreusis TaxID=1969 RepID=UPI0035DFDED6